MPQDETRKVRVSITVDKDLAEQIEKHYRQLLKTAIENEEEHLPKLANVYEDLVRKSWSQIKKK